MAVILENTYLGDVVYKMTVKADGTADLGKCGQFYMIKTSCSCDPLLGRPISIFDTDTNNCTVTFIYAVVGRGTELMSKMRVSDSIEMYGPFGRPFPLIDSDITLIGGGVGGAPLYLLAKMHRQLYPNRHITIHLGFRDEQSVLLSDEFKQICDEVVLNIGGYVTDDVDFTCNRIFYACGTEPMMAAACRGAHVHNATLYISLDKHMACGVGACLACTCKTADGTKKRACKDGPVFISRDVFDAERGYFYE